MSMTFKQIRILFRIRDEHGYRRNTSLDDVISDTSPKQTHTLTLLYEATLMSLISRETSQHDPAAYGSHNDWWKISVMYYVNVQM